MLAVYKPDSVRSAKQVDNRLIIYLDFQLPESSIRLPINSGVLPSNTDLHGVSPHRVYLISLQPYLYLLSVALVLPCNNIILLQDDGCYPLCCTLVSGLSSLTINIRAIRKPHHTKIPLLLISIGFSILKPILQYRSIFIFVVLSSG